MRPLHALFVLAVAAVVAFLIWPAGKASVPTTDSEETALPAASSPTPISGLGVAPPRGSAPGMGSARAPAVTPVDLGTIRVTISATGGPALAKSARVELEALGPVPHAHPLAVPQTDGTYLFEEVPTGRYRVRVMSEGSQDGVAEARVEKGVEAAIELALRPGGVASYAVSLYSGEEPATVAIALFDGRGVAVGASIQTVATTLHVGAERRAGLPPTGKVIGLKPGRYTLQATSPEGETDEKSFDAKEGEVVALDFKIRK